MARDSQAYDPKTKSANCRGSSSSKSGSIPAVSFPKSGGAIANLGEKLQVLPSTGTANLSVPISTSSSRASIEPDLSLTYDSSNGNGVFGLGWTLSTLNITRETEKGLPQYYDTEESDVFVMTGSQGLVPLFQKNDNGAFIRDESGALIVQEDFRDGYAIRKYKARVEESFSRIERWTKSNDPSSCYWRVISKDNVTTIFGGNANPRISDPANAEKVFTWLISETYDMKGNAMIFKYEAENSVGVLESTDEQNRTDRTRSSNRYLKTISYVNRIPNRDESWNAFSAFDLANDSWMFTVAFDYGQYDPDFPSLDTQTEWLARQDPFSTYRAGFEIRTYRLCHRILMFHHFLELGIDDHLVSSTNLTYDENPCTSLESPMWDTCWRETDT